MLVDRDLTIRVADFGMSRQKHKEKLSCSKAAGTAEWTAPGNIPPNKFPSSHC